MVVAQYRAALNAEKLKKYQEENEAPYNLHHKGTTSMFEKVLTPVAKKLFNARNMAMSISKSTSIRNLPKTEDHASDTRDAAGSISIRTETMEVNEYAKCMFLYIKYQSIHIIQNRLKTLKKCVTKNMTNN